jgi:hypothetical protein
VTKEDEEYKVTTAFRGFKMFGRLTLFVKQQHFCIDVKYRTEELFLNKSQKAEKNRAKPMFQKTSRIK